MPSDNLTLERGGAWIDERILALKATAPENNGDNLAVAEPIRASRHRELGVRMPAPRVEASFLKLQKSTKGKVRHV